MKHALAALSAVLLCDVCIAHAAPFLDSSSFKDVPAHSKYFDAIEYARDHDIVEGYDDGTFRPEALINRAEFTKIVISATQDDTETQGCIGSAPASFFYSPPFLFADTVLNAWYLPYLCQAKKEKIVDGYPDGTFRPGRFINVAEASQIVAHAFALPQTETGAVWYDASINALADVHALPTDFTNVDAPVTRGAMVEVLYRLLAKITDRPTATLESLTQ